MEIKSGQTEKTEMKYLESKMGIKTISILKEKTKEFTQEMILTL